MEGINPEDYDVTDANIEQFTSNNRPSLPATADVLVVKNNTMFHNYYYCVSKH